MILTTMMRRLSVMALLALAPLSVAAQQVVEVADPNTTLEGEVLGSYYVDYVFPATAGKTLLVMLLPNGSVNFNVLGPDTSAPPIYEPTRSAGREHADHSRGWYLYGAGVSDGR